MDEIYRTLANDINRERDREAAQWRLARQVRRGAPSTGHADRVRRFLGGIVARPLPAPTLTPDTSVCGS
jgi:hypothetical protein